jgi:hypothetical protein
MKRFEVFYFVGGEEETLIIEANYFGQLYPELEKILYQSELRSIYRIEEIFSHDDEKYADDVVDEEILNGFVGAPN